MHHIRAMDLPVSRSQITDALGVSRSKISMEVGRLVEAGLLAEDGQVGGWPSLLASAHPSLCWADSRR
jgi:transposase